MASTASPYGMRPVKLIGGQPYSGAVTHYPIASAYGTDIFYGDVVELRTGEGAPDGTIERATADAAIAQCLGVFLGCAYTDATYGFTHRQYWPASQVATDAVAYICDDPDVLFEIQADGAVAQTLLGQNFALAETLAGQTTTGNSRNVLDADTNNTTNTLPVTLVGFVDRPGSVVGDDFTDCIVRINTHRNRVILGLAG